MFFLLDINVLIALADPGHQFHSAFNKWYILLSLTVRHRGKFLSFDRGIHAERVAGGVRAFELLS